MIHEKENFPLQNWELVSVNPVDKNWEWKDLFSFWAVNIQSIFGFSLIASLYLVYDLNFFVVLSGCLLGSLLVYIFANLISKPSQRHGIPFPVLLRISTGVNGARYIAFLRGLVGIFMFGVQTYFLSKSFSYLIRMGLYSYDNTILDNDYFLTFLFGMNIIDWIAFIFSIFLQFYLFTKGHLFNKFFINLAAIIVYFGLILFLIIVVSENYNELAKSFSNLIIIENIISKPSIVAIISIAGTIFAYFSIIIVNLGDFSRYVKNEKELNKGNLSLFLNLIIFSFFSVLLVTGSDIILYKNSLSMDKILTNPTDIIGKIDNIFLSVVVIFFILFASISTNLIANYIPSQNSLLNLFPSSLNLLGSGVVIAIIGSVVGIFWLTILSQIGVLSFVDTVASFFGPIFGVIITDYYLIKNSEIKNKYIFSSATGSEYYYSKGWNLKAIYALLIGFIFSAATIWNSELRFLQSFSWLIGAFFGSITYYLLSKK